MRKLSPLKLFGFFLVLTFAIVFIGFHLLQAQSKGKPAPPAPPPNPLVTLNPGYIITSESNALRIWDCNIPPYDSRNPVWSISRTGTGNLEVAVGNVDKDTNKEIVVSEIYEVKEGKGKFATSYFMVFLNVYKEGIEGIWKSTKELGEGDGYIKERGLYSVLIADVIPETGSEPSINEVIILTQSNLAIFRYDSAKDNFYIVKQITTDEVVEILGSGYYFKAVTSKDLDRDNHDEILVSAIKYDGAATVPEKRYVSSLFQIDDIDKDHPTITPLTSVDGFLGFCLRVADLDEDENPEICSTCWKLFGIGPETGVLYQAYVYVWDYVQDTDGPRLGEYSYCIIPGWQTPNSTYPYLCLDTGKLVEADNTEKEKIVISANRGDSLYYLYLYNYSASTLALEYQMPLPDVGSYISDIEIGEVNAQNSGNEIVVAGRAKTVTNFYLEVFDSFLSSIWKRIGVSPKEGSISDTAIVKQD